MSVRKGLLIAILAGAVSTVAPRHASADWIVTPFVGWNTGGAADVSGSGGEAFSNKFEHKVDYGVSIAGMGDGIAGFELDFGYSPNFFETGTTGEGFDFTNDSNVTTLTGNLILGAPAGGHGGSVRPYVVGGVGLIRTNVQDTAGFFDVTSKNDFGFDAGAGIMGFFAQNVGIRGDFRYFRTFKGTTDNPTGLDLSNFHFWRGSVGVSFKF